MKLRSPILVLLLAVACGTSEATTPSTAPPSGESPANAPVADDPNGGGGKSDPMDGDPDAPWTPPTETGPVTFPYTAYRCGYPVRQVSPSRPAAVFHDEAAIGNTPLPKNLHLTIAGNASSSVVFEWQTDDATKQTEVRFGEAADKLDRVAHGYSFASGSKRQHELHLCGLKAGKTYYYDAGGGANRSTVHKFTTAPDTAGDVTVLVLGDSRTDPSKLGGFAAKALSFGPTVLVFTGDAVASGGQQGQWDALFGAAPDLFAEVPGYWANGNHEGLAEPYFHQMALPDHNGGTTQIEEWYAATYGPIRFIVLNDNVSNDSQITGPERQFLEAELKAVDRNRTPFVVSLHHEPMYTVSSSHSSNTQIRNAWGPLFAQYKVNADLAGHVHSYESSKPMMAGTTTVVAENAGGTRFFNFGGSGAPLYGFSSTTPAWLQTKESTNGFAIMRANAQAIVWTAYRGDGSTIETITMTKQ